MLQTIINMISGLAGGNITGAAAKKINPGMIISSVSGLVGGGLGGALITSSMNSGGRMDLETIVSGVAASAAAGAILTALVGFIRTRITTK